MNTIFAIIYKEIIQNMIVGDYYSANQCAKDTYGSDALAVECTRYGASIGDKYVDGKFYKKSDGSEIPYIPTAEEQVAKLTVENNELKNSLADLTQYILDKEI